MEHLSRLIVLACVALGFTVLTAYADEWPEVQGAGRRSVWNETGLLDKFPAEGLTVRWRTPVGPGYTGPAVAGGRVFVADYHKTGAAQVERVLCLDEQTGKDLWSYENKEVKYANISYGYGPRATPTVDGERVYVLGAVGDLYCLETQTGKLCWKVNYQADFKAKVPTWGFTAAPLVYGKLLLCLANAEPDGKVLALDKQTGKEVWRALAAKGSISYAAPIIVKVAGVDQLIVANPTAITALNPTGAVHWEQPCTARLLVATPVLDGDQLLISSFFNGSVMLKLAQDKPGATLLWKGSSSSEVTTDGLHAMNCTPVIKDGFIYGVCSYGQLRCLDAKTGKRVWESMEAVKENARWANAFITRQGERFFINNDRGELIIAELSPQGYKEISRTNLIKPTTDGGGKRELRAVNWVLPAFANRHIFIRNDEEIIKVSLEGK